MFPACDRCLLNANVNQCWEQAELPGRASAQEEDQRVEKVERSQARVPWRWLQQGPPGQLGDVLRLRLTHVHSGQSLS